MGVKRYTAGADNTITDAYESNMTTRGTGSNMGHADTLEVFHIYGQESSASHEYSRILINFPVSDISTDRTSNNIPASGSVSFYLKMFNAEHASSVPAGYTLEVLPISQSWEEGNGLDMENYSDKTYDFSGSNWMNANSGTTWSITGSDLLTSPVSNVSFTNGYEDLEVNISELVENWITGSGGSKFDNYGVCIRMSSSIESSSVTQYTKKFFARSSEFFFKRPVIEARWDSATKDDRGNFYHSSALATAADNLNTIYLYNLVRGQMADIPGIGSADPIYVNLYSGSANNKTPTGTALILPVGGGVPTAGQAVTGGQVPNKTGLYSASFAFTAAANPVTKTFDVWSSGSVEYYTGSILAVNPQASNANPNSSFVTTINNFRDTYSRKESLARMRLYSRLKDWSPTIYTVASKKLNNYIVEKIYYKVYRISDNYQIIPYGTGSDDHTRLSYDTSGSYFDFDMGMLESDYMYGIRFLFYLNGAYIEQEEEFKFRVAE